MVQRDRGRGSGGNRGDSGGSDANREPAGPTTSTLQNYVKQTALATLGLTNPGVATDAARLMYRKMLGVDDANIAMVLEGAEKAQAIRTQHQHEMAQWDATPKVERGDEPTLSVPSLYEHFRRTSVEAQGVFYDKRAEVLGGMDGPQRLGCYKVGGSFMVDTPGNLVGALGKVRSKTGELQADSTEAKTLIALDRYAVQAVARGEVEKEIAERTLAGIGGGLEDATISA